MRCNVLCLTPSHASEPSFVHQQRILRSHRADPRLSSTAFGRSRLSCTASAMGPRWMNSVRSGAACTLAACLSLGSTGCRRGAVAQEMTEVPTVSEATGQARCGVRKSADKPLVVEWPAAERAALEARATRGLVAVRYEGCDMEVLTTCSIEGSYDYVGLTRKREGVRITNADELYAKLPVGAAGLEAKLERSGALEVDMTIVGRRESTQGRFHRSELVGQCDGATHVITGLTIGAYALLAGASASVGGGATMGNVGVGAGSSSSQELLKADGQTSMCDVARSSDEAPPEGCGALLRIEVVPLEEPSFNPTSTASTTSESSGSSSSRPVDEGPTFDPRYDKKITRARIAGAVGYGSMALGGVSLAVGWVLFTRAKSALEGEKNTDEVSDDRSSNIARYRAGLGLVVGGSALAVAGAILTIWGNQRLSNLRRGRSARIDFAPMIGAEEQGIAITGRF